MSDELIEWLNKLVGKGYSKNTISDILASMPPNLYKELPASNGGIGYHGEKVKFVMKWLEEEGFENKISFTNNEKRKINVLVADNTNADSEIDFLKRGFDVTVLNISDYKKKFDRNDVHLVIFTGGEDVSPEYYNEGKGKYTHCNKARDTKEANVYSEFKNKSAMFGICRGAQFLTVMNGGKLIQHVEGHGQSHTIMVEKRGIFEMTSVHHQMMYPYNTLAQNYEILGYSEYFRSETYLDGENKEIDISKQFVEPEIIFYKNTKSLCIQGHPEYGSCPEKTKDLCIQLIYDYLFPEKEVNSNNKFMPEKENTFNPTFTYSDGGFRDAAYIRKDSPTYMNQYVRQPDGKLGKLEKVKK